MSTLIKRLRKHRFYLNTAYQDQWQISEDMRDAADALEKAQAEISDYKELLEAERRVVYKREAEVERLLCDYEKEDSDWANMCGELQLENEKLQARIERLEEVRDFAEQQRCVVFERECVHCYAVAAAEDE